MKFSIITINYNNCEGLRRTLESVVNQTCRDFEYIVIDGGSTDGSKELIEQYADRIDYWVSEPDKGIYNAMNKGIAVAKGEYCNFMNSGDTFVDSGVLDNALRCSFTEDIVTGIQIVGVYKKGLFSKLRVDYPQEQPSALRFYTGSISHQSSFIRTALLKPKGYREDFKIVSDWVFFFDELVFNNCSYRSLDIQVANFDTQGISSQTETSVYTLHMRERQEYINQRFLPRIMIDYDRLVYGATPLEKIVCQWGEHSIFRKILFLFAWLLDKIRSLKRAIWK